MANIYFPIFRLFNTYALCSFFQTDVLEGGWGPKTLVQNQTIKVFGSDKMDWRGESFIITGNIRIWKCMIGSNWIFFDYNFQLFFFKLIFSYCIGVVAYAFAVLLGITSLPSVTAALSWKEFAFIQSKLGWTCLIFAVAHDLFYGWPYINALSCYIPPTFQVR